VSYAGCNNQERRYELKKYNPYLAGMYPVRSFYHTLPGRCSSGCGMCALVQKEMR